MDIFCSAGLGQIAPKGLYHMIKSRFVTVLAVILMVLAVLGTSVVMMSPQIIETFSASTVKAYETKLFQENTVMEFNIVVDEADWQEFLDNSMAEEYIPVDVEINGETFKEVGLRTKGNTSLMGVSNDRYSLKVEFDHYIDGQNCYGLDKIALNNMYCDPTYMKEYLSYDMMRFLEVPSSLCAFAKVSVNGEYWGLYLAIECLEESYMERNFGSDYGNLYKPDTMNMGGDNGGMQPPDNADWENRDPGTDTVADGGQNRKDKEANNSDAAGSASVNGGGPAGNGDFSPPDGTQASPPEQPDKTGSNEASAPADGTENDNTLSSPFTSGAQQSDGGENTPPSQGGQSTDGQGENRDTGGGGFPGGDFPGGGFSGGMGGATSLTDQGDDPDNYSAIFDSTVFDITESDKQHLIEAIQNLNAGTDLEKYVDVDEVLRYFAVNTVLVNLDSYASNMKHNYYLYEKDGQISILPWDYNLAFGAFQAGSAESAVNFPIDTPVSGTSLEDSPLIGKLLEVDEYREKYHQYLKQIVDGYFSSGYFENTIDTINALISDEVATDPTALYSYDEYLEAVEMLKEFGALRAESIEGQLNGSIPSTDEGQEADPEALVDASAIDMNVLGQQGGGGGFPGGDRGDGFASFGGDSAFSGSPPDGGRGQIAAENTAGEIPAGGQPPSDAEGAQGGELTGTAETDGFPPSSASGENSSQESATSDEGQDPAGEETASGEESAQNNGEQNIPTAGESPFDGMPDMKLMRQAMEIIGDTEFADLTDDQKAQLTELGLSDEDLAAFSDMQQSLPQGGFGGGGSFGPSALSSTDWKSTALLLGVSGIFLIGGVIFALCFRRRR